MRAATMSYFVRKGPNAAQMMTVSSSYMKMHRQCKLEGGIDEDEADSDGAGSAAFGVGISVRSQLLVSDCLFIVSSKVFMTSSPSESS